MNQKRFTFLNIFRIMLICILAIMCVFFTFKNYWYSFTLFFILLVFLSIEYIMFIKNQFSLTKKIINALLYDDFSLDVNQKVISKNKNAIKLYNKIKIKHSLNNSKEILYHQLLNSVPSGFLILKEEQNDYKIIFMNRFFQELFNIPQASSWAFLKKIIPDFCEILEQNNFENQKNTIEIQVNNEEKQTYVFQNSKTVIAQENYFIVFLDSIQRVIDLTEKEAWINIMKIISHEIINSLTPIHSLAHSTKMYLENDFLEKDDLDDIRLSLDTIMSRSNHLQTFVEQYRQLTTLPTPIKNEYNLNEIINKIQVSFQSILNDEKIEFKNNVPKNIKVFVDCIQFEQALINLIKNALHAVDNSKTKLININTKQTENRLQIIIEDSGDLIDNEIISKIFLPFYTTRNNGTGIGLTLSKNIIEAHNGYLYYQQNDNIKQFIIVLKV